MNRLFRNRNRSEQAAAYKLLLPTLLIIAAVAVWPVIQSFWFSTFDYALNDPRKSTLHTNYCINLEKYLNNYPYLINQIERETENTDSGVKAELEQLRKKLVDSDERIRRNPKIHENYTFVNNLVSEMTPVENKYRFYRIDKATADEMQGLFEDIEADLRRLAQRHEFLNRERIIGLAESLGECIITPNFVGLKNYANLLVDKRVQAAVLNTLFFTIVSVFFELLLGMIFSLVMNKASALKGIVRASVLIPWAIPTVVSALIWSFLYDGQNGIVAKAFCAVGIIPDMGHLLATPTGAVFSIIFADTWKTSPYMALLILAGLQTIPLSVYEAATIDGASKTKSFFFITLPLLKQTILVALLFRTLEAFKIFDLVYILTGGGPSNSTETLSVLAYKLMFAQTNFGMGSALSIITFVCVALISVVYIKTLGEGIISD